MSRKRFDDSHCAVARALDEVGDWWSLRIVLQAMYGSRRFVDFQQQLGIARNILGDRLARLVANGVLRKVEVGERGSRHEYRLTDKGRALFTVVEALRQWGERWTETPPQAPRVELHDCRDGRPVAAVQVCAEDGRPLSVRDVFVSLDGEPAATQAPDRRRQE